MVATLFAAAMFRKLRNEGRPSSGGIAAGKPDCRNGSRNDLGELSCVDDLRYLPRRQPLLLRLLVLGPVIELTLDRQREPFDPAEAPSLFCSRLA